MLNVISSKRNEKKKINVKDIIKENSKTKQNECVSYEKKRVERKKNCPCSFNKSTSEYKYSFFFLLQLC